VDEFSADALMGMTPVTEHGGASCERRDPSACRGFRGVAGVEKLFFSLAHSEGERGLPGFLALNLNPNR